ncbi:hypothetical protein AK830_g4342 [Neonectria ditissima]|uniref:Major facilitator superfamily (MFS) profile domain-containing protein n=1 Tax=Neonectria ditissima TaxID=78410 RepID=A0A0P7BNK7_9HYPO|nr:hypothetical protein AK830_g4342 [Neonectria ditissima]
MPMLVASSTWPPLATVRIVRLLQEGVGAIRQGDDVLDGIVESESGVWGEAVTSVAHEYDPPTRALVLQSPLLYVVESRSKAGPADDVRNRELLVLCAFLALSTFGSSGNLILDPKVLLEFLPGSKQWVVTALAGWWGFGQSIAGFIAWGFLTDKRLNCTEDDNCGWSNNAGWRYVMFTCGALVLVASILRVTVVRLKESPKYLLSVGRDADLVELYRDLALKYNRPCSLTEEALAACGPVSGSGKQQSLLAKLAVHVNGLFTTRKTSATTVMVWASWAITGLAYPLFYVFLPTYLSTRISDSTPGAYETWRNTILTTVAGIPGPILAGYMVGVPALGRKYTMVIGALSGMALFFGFTGVSTQAQNVGISCTISFSINVYYSTLYAYTVEVLPSAHRATGNGIAVSFNRLMGIVSAFVASSANTATSAPLYVCAALFGGLALISALFPFEPRGRRSS